MSGLAPAPCPLAAQELKDYRLTRRQRAPLGRSGLHRHRRRGQSLDFREHSSYTPGDDFRHIDWRATVRRGPPRELRDLLVRRFEADEQLTLLISIDNRRTLAPRWDGASKWQVARWLVEATAAIALADRDRLHLHRLFGPAAGPRALGSLGAVRRFLDRSEDALQPAAAEPELGSLRGLLPPSAVWVILTDLYFDDPGGVLARVIRRTLDGPRGVLVIELDSWPHERAMLGRGARRIEGPGRDIPLEVLTDEPLIATIGRRIADHRERWLEGVRRPGFEHDRWPWPEVARLDGDALASFFRRRFLADRPVGNLFRRGS